MYKKIKKIIFSMLMAYGLSINAGMDDGCSFCIGKSSTAAKSADMQFAQEHFDIIIQKSFPNPKVDDTNTDTNIYTNLMTSFCLTEYNDLKNTRGYYSLEQEGPNDCYTGENEDYSS